MALLKVTMGGPNLLLPSPPQFKKLLGVDTWSLLIRELSSGRTDRYGVVGDGKPSEEVRVPPHFPFIKIRCRNVHDDNQRKPAMVFKRKGETFHLYRLGTDFLRIGGEIQGVIPDRRPIHPKQVRATNFSGSLRWMVDMEDLLPKAGLVDSRWILDNGFPQDGRLACWLILDKGSLYTNSLGTPGRAISEWDIRRKNRPDEPIHVEGFPRPVAYSIALEVQIEESVDLLFLSHGQEAPQKIRLVPAGDEVIEISILNEEMEEVVDFSEGEAVNGDFDDDAGAVYQLSKVGRATRNRPLPHRVGVFGDGGYGGLGSDTVACGTSGGGGFLGFGSEWKDVRNALQTLYGIKK